MSHLRASILTYHSIDRTGSIVSTSPDTFRAQMRHLKNNSFNVISLVDIAACISDNQPLPPKSVAITFDDGFKNFYHIAYPILKKYGFCATVFLVTGYCGRKNEWNGQPKGIPVLDLLDWDDIRHIASNGIDFGAHTVNHPNLSDLPQDAALQEIVTSKSMIESHLGIDVPFFAYPYGKLDNRVKTIVEKEFSGACSTDLDFVRQTSDIHFLPRIDMYYFSQNNLFELHGHLAFTIYLWLRRLLRTLRPYTSLSN